MTSNKNKELETELKDTQELIRELRQSYNKARKDLIQNLKIILSAMAFLLLLLLIPGLNERIYNALLLLLSIFTFFFVINLVLRIWTYRAFNKSINHFGKQAKALSNKLL